MKMKSTSNIRLQNGDATGKGNVNAEPGDIFDCSAADAALYRSGGSAVDLTADEAAEIAKSEAEAAAKASEEAAKAAEAAKSAAGSKGGK